MAIDPGFDAARVRPLREIPGAWRRTPGIAAGLMRARISASGKPATGGRKVADRLP